MLHSRREGVRESEGEVGRVRESPGDSKRVWESKIPIASRVKKNILKQELLVGPDPDFRGLLCLEGKWTVCVEMKICFPVPFHGMLTVFLYPRIDQNSLDAVNTASSSTSGTCYSCPRQIIDTD